MLGEGGEDQAIIVRSSRPGSRWIPQRLEGPLRAHCYTLRPSAIHLGPLRPTAIHSMEES